MSPRTVQVTIVITLLLIVLLMMPEVSRSVPSFARQTELPCSNCHTVFPELNSFGRLFKLNGYTLASEEAIESKGENDRSLLRLPKIPPFSAMIQTSYTHLKKAQPGTQNGNASFPQQFSFFFAGEITPNLGGFVQLTWDDQSSAFDFDLLDFRYSHQFNLGERNLILGLTLNNTPTVQDVWNSTPIWSFPYAGSAIAPTPGVSPLLSGGLEGFEQSFVGLGAYSLYNNLLYGEVSLYRSTPHGGTADPPDSTSSGVSKSLAPYWRLVLQHQWPNLYLSGGTYGLYGSFYPTGVTGSTDRYTDLGFDGQVMSKVGPGTITAHSTWVHEKRNLEATYAAGGSLQSGEKSNLFKIDANYYLKQRYGLSVGYFASTADADSLLYTPAPMTGFSTGKPNSSGVILEFDYLPWMNTKLSLQYIMYSKFNGASSNYDGFGRNASDNNTVYLLAWFAM